MPLANRRSLLVAVGGDEDGRRVDDAAQTLQFPVVRVTRPEDLPAFAEANLVALVIDRHFLGPDGTAIVAGLRGGRFEEAPLLVLGDWSDTELAGLFEAGADVALPAGADPTLIAAQLRRSIARQGRLAELRLALERQRRERDELQAAYSERDESVAMVIHDLKSPLAALIGLLDHLGAGGGEDEKELLELARAEAEYVSGLAADALDLRRLEAGVLVPERSAIDDLQGLLQQALLDSGARFRRRDVRFHVEAPAPVQADPRLLRRVLTNLVANALKFTRDGGAIIVGARRDGSRLVVSVSDDGPGIHPDDMAKVLGRSGGRRLQGGLGLAFCRLAVEGHGGRIWFEPGVGRGTVVAFDIPDAFQAVEAAAGSE